MAPPTPKGHLGSCSNDTCDGRRFHCNPGRADFEAGGVRHTAACRRRDLPATTCAVSTASDVRPVRPKTGACRRRSGSYVLAIQPRRPIPAFDLGEQGTLELWGVLLARARSSH